MPLTPRPIHNIIPPSGNNGTNSTDALPGAEQVSLLFARIEVLHKFLYLELFASVINYLKSTRQVEGLKYKVPEIIGVAVTFVAVIVLLLSIVYGVRRRSYSIKSQRSPLDVSRRYISHRN